MTKGRMTIAETLGRQMGERREIAVQRFAGKDEDGNDKWVEGIDVRLPVTRKMLDEECPPVELHTELLVEIPALYMGIEADEVSYRIERRPVHDLAFGIDRMEAETNQRFNWLAEHGDTGAFAERIEAAAAKADLDTPDEAEAADTVWLGDEMCLRWRRAMARAREFNAILKAVRAELPAKRKNDDA